jgi:hypothetical protein
LFRSYSERVYTEIFLENIPAKEMLGTFQQTDFTGGTGKAIPLQAWTGLEGSRMLRLTDFKTIGTWRW